MWNLSRDMDQRPLKLKIGNSSQKTRKSRYQPLHALPSLTGPPKPAPNILPMIADP